MITNLNLTRCIVNLVFLSSPFRYSLCDPSASVQGTYKCELNKALHNNSSLLGQLNDAFNKVNPCLAKKVLTQTAREAVAEIFTNALVSKALSLRRVHAGGDH